MLLIRRRGKRRGKVVVLVAVCLVPLLGITAIALDGGDMRDERRSAQGAADAAALAAAADLYENYPTYDGYDTPGTAASSALAVAAAHGYANDGATSVVTVNIPPVSGNFVGEKGHVEVTITCYKQRSFSAIFGSGSLEIMGRAVARGRSDTFRRGFLLLHPDKSDSFQHSGNGPIDVVGGSIIVNSDADPAFQKTGSGSITADSIAITGDIQENGSIYGPIKTGVPPTPDPLRFIPEPDRDDYPTVSSKKYSVSLNDGQVAVLQPGVYRYGIDIGGKGLITLLPGVYIMYGGGFKLSGDANVVGDGVMIYNMVGPGGDHGQVLMSGNGSLTLTPPTTGLYRGIGIFQERTLIDTVQVSGNGKYQVSGVLYAKSAHVYLSGNGTNGVDTLGGSVVANTCQVSGNGTFNVDLGGSPNPPVRDIFLVE